MRKPIIEAKYTKMRRDRLSKRAQKGQTFIFFSGHAPTRSNDTNYKFRVDSNFFYLTGFEEENAVLVFRPGQSPEAVMFVQKKDPHFETWEGFIYGEEGVKKNFGISEVYANTELEERLPNLLMDSSDVYFRMGFDENNDSVVLKTLRQVLRKKGRKGHPMQNIKDPDEHLAKLRMIKSAEEIELMKKTCEISAKAHIEMIKNTRPGVNERYLEGVFFSSIMKEGAMAQSYNPIVASGASATTLHYCFNDQDCAEGELLLVDAGSEYKYYAGDITRTYPVGSKFSEIQKKMYEGVLKVQKDLIAMVKPGCTFQKLNEASSKALTEFMIELSLLKGSVDENIQSGAYKKYYPHSVGHFIGIDVHDVGYYEENGKPVEFSEGMMLTIEPGLYVPFDDESAPVEMRGIGIRIEDDVLVTSGDPDVMTRLVPKEAVDLEALKAQ